MTHSPAEHDHQHDHHQHDEPELPITAAEWDARYDSSSSVWSGNANAVLVAEASAWRPGTALDAGAGEGGDAIWLASRGWTVSGADHSAVGLERASRAAHDAGVEVTWLVLDLVQDPSPAQYDLVTSHFMHVPKEEQPPLFQHLAGAVAPGGRLLVVGHDLSDAHASAHGPRAAEMTWAATDVADQLDDAWAIEACEVRVREGLDREGNAMTFRDAVVLARKI